MFLEPAKMSTSNTRFDGSAAYAPHFYPWSLAPKYYPKNMTTLGADMAAKRQTLALSSNVPIWIGEFGTFMKVHGAEHWLGDAKTLFDKCHVGWT
jgi:hypothetical protein